MNVIYQGIIYRPLLNTLIFFYNTIAFHNLGVAIIFFTIFVRLLLYPLFHKSTRQQMIMQRLAPHVKRIQDEHKHDREKQTRALMDLYHEHGVNPFSSFLFLLVQLPILIALFAIFRNVGSDFSPFLYSFIRSPGILNPLFLGLINLGRPSILIVSLAALSQYFQGKLTLPPQQGNEKSANDVARMMIYLAPVLTIAIFYNFPAAVGLYWIVSSLFSIGQQIVIKRHLQELKTP